MLVVNMPIDTAGVSSKIDKLVIDDITYQVDEVKGIKIFVNVNTNDLELAKSLLKNFLKDLVGAGVFFNVEVK